MMRPSLQWPLDTCFSDFFLYSTNQYVCILKVNKRINIVNKILERLNFICDSMIYQMLSNRRKFHFLSLYKQRPEDSQGSLERASQFCHRGCLLHVLIGQVCGVRDRTDERAMLHVFEAKLPLLSIISRRASRNDPQQARAAESNLIGEKTQRASIERPRLVPLRSSSNLRRVYFVEFTRHRVNDTSYSPPVAVAIIAIASLNLSQPRG